MVINYKMWIVKCNMQKLQNSCIMWNTLPIVLLFVSVFLSLSLFQAANAGKSLFLLYALKRSPRVTIFYLYLFDYSETFLPFLHTCCPAITHIEHSVESSFLISQVKLNKLSAYSLLCCIHLSGLQWAKIQAVNTQIDAEIKRNKDNPLL